MQIAFRKDDADDKWRNNVFEKACRWSTGCDRKINEIVLEDLQSIQRPWHLSYVLVWLSYGRHWPPWSSGRTIQGCYAEASNKMPCSPLQPFHSRRLWASQPLQEAPWLLCKTPVSPAYCPFKSRQRWVFLHINTITIVVNPIHKGTSRVNLRHSTLSVIILLYTLRS